MKHLVIFIGACLLGFQLRAQQVLTDDDRVEIKALIDKYSLARETRDTSLLRAILTADIDQLVSTGEWRNGVNSSVEGMLRSSANNAGKRTLTIEKIRLIDTMSAIVDCRYVIESQKDKRNMWSTFIVINDKGNWKITAIRNMAPSGQ
jgi:hypothetical protein